MLVYVVGLQESGAC